MSVEIFNLHRKIKFWKNKSKRINYNIIPELIPYNEQELKEGDTLVLHFDIEEFDIDECQKMFEVVAKEFPNNKVLALAGSTKIEVVRKK